MTRMSRPDNAGTDTAPRSTNATKAEKIQARNLIVIVLNAPARERLMSRKFPFNKNFSLKGKYKGRSLFLFNGGK